jgi:hypothetical protein
MKVQVTYRSVTSTVPPHCRKPRLISDEHILTVSIPVATQLEAPVAIRHDSSIASAVDYRWWRKRLYTLYKPHSRQIEPSHPGSVYFPHDQKWSPSSGSTSRQAAIAAIRAHYRTFLIIDGLLWQRTTEPRYVVMTFGLGHNHGGTAVLVEHGRNPNIDARHYLPANAFTAAQDFAIAIAERRGDTDSVIRINTSQPQLAILIPAAITLKRTTRADRYRSGIIASDRRHEASK